MNAYKAMKDRHAAERQSADNDSLQASLRLNIRHAEEIRNALFNGGQINAEFADQMFYYEMDNTEYLVNESPAPVLAACNLTAADLEQFPELKAAFARAAARYMAKRNG